MAKASVAVMPASCSGETLVKEEDVKEEDDREKLDSPGVHTHRPIGIDR